jgi:hypothetical protein
LLNEKADVDGFAGERKRKEENAKGLVQFISHVLFTLSITMPVIAAMEINRSQHTRL